MALQKFLLLISLFMLSVVCVVSGDGYNRASEVSLSPYESWEKAPQLGAPDFEVDGEIADADGLESFHLRRPGRRRLGGSDSINNNPPASRSV